ncbi:MAG: site-specific integrase [Prevotella sp.]|nr:site-specific integrase [Prevotella sp.]
MATIKVKYRPSTVKGREGTLFFQIIHRRIARQINTGYRLFTHEWDCAQGRVDVTSATDNVRHRYLEALETDLRNDLSRLQAIVTRIEGSGRNYDADGIVALFGTARNDVGFVAFARTLIAHLSGIGRTSISTAYATTISSFLRFLDDRRDVALADFDSDLMQAYEVWLRAGGLCPNSSSYYMRNLRAIYNRAVERELTVQNHPFRHVYTGVDKTVKRAVPLRVIRRIRDMDLTDSPALDYARDMFMFSFYTRGMSFVDMAFLQKKDLHNGILSYRRRKTNQLLTIKWEKPMQDIVDKYDTTASPYILPIIRDIGRDGRRQYKNVAHFVNIKLKSIGRRINLDIPLTTYVARHGWASIARSKNIPLATISEAMGHDSETTTRIYLASLDTSVVDRANHIILSSL